ncbi:hypothetical protein LCGC14_0341070 [marine sediment metagenome]|uniref:Homing endonuclease LAGLIDADG domain-containing protein n=1 Tax=marine sediment metagenome TaxID=412755 RepID=A0A0F9TDM2_9ZZZZ
MKIEEATWLACAVDGEGWLGLYTKYKWPVVEIGITNTSVAFLQYAVKIAGGKVRNGRKGGDGKKAMFRMSIKGHKHVLIVLKDIFPYLIIKKGKALEMMQFIEGRIWGVGSPQARKNKKEVAIKNWANPIIRAKYLNSMRHGIDSCTICGDKYFARGFCQTHYNTVWRKKTCVSS